MGGSRKWEGWRSWWGRAAMIFMKRGVVVGFYVSQIELRSFVHGSVRDRDGLSDFALCCPSRATFTQQVPLTRPCLLHRISPSQPAIAFPLPSTGCPTPLCFPFSFRRQVSSRHQRRSVQSAHTDPCTHYPTLCFLRRIYMICPVVSDPAITQGRKKGAVVVKTNLAIIIENDGPALALTCTDPLRTAHLSLPQPSGQLREHAPLHT